MVESVAQTANFRTHFTDRARAANSSVSEARAFMRDLEEIHSRGETPAEKTVTQGRHLLQVLDNRIEDFAYASAIGIGLDAGDIDSNVAALTKGVEQAEQTRDRLRAAIAKM